MKLGCLVPLSELWPWRLYARWNLGHLCFCRRRERSVGAKTFANATVNVTGTADITNWAMAALSHSTRSTSVPVPPFSVLVERLRVRSLTSLTSLSSAAFQSRAIRMSPSRRRSFRSQVTTVYLAPVCCCSLVFFVGRCSGLPLAWVCDGRESCQGSPQDRTPANLARATYVRSLTPVPDQSLPLMEIARVLCPL